MNRHDARLRRLLFVHIPKTGGISLHSQLQKVFAPERSIRFGDRTSNRAFEYLPDEELRRFDYVTGHQPLKTFRSRGVDHPAVVLFRDPVRRAVSLFTYLNESQHADHLDYRFDTFDEFVEWSQRSHASFHVQCRFVAGTRVGTRFEKEPMSAARALDYLESDLVLPVVLERHYDDLLATLSDLLGTELTNVRMNVSRSLPSPVEREHLDRLEPLVGEDRLLYEEVGRRYQEYKSRFLDGLRQRAS